MRIAIIGAGRIGGELGRRLAVNHEVVLGSRSADRGKELAKQIGAARGTTQAEATKGADVTILSVPWWGVKETLAALDDLDGQILIDVTNPFVARGYSEMHELPGSSAAQEIQASKPRATVVKAWNHVFSPVAAHGADFGGVQATVLICGDGEPAKATVTVLASELGYRAIDVGPLSEAAFLERLCGFLVRVWHDRGLGCHALVLLPLTQDLSTSGGSA